MDDATLGAIIAADPFSSEPHLHSPQTVGEVVRAIVAIHPARTHATREEVEALIDAVSTLAGGKPVSYRLGGAPGGLLGGPGTWFSTTTAGVSHGISGTIAAVYPQDQPPEDPTLLPRLVAELHDRIIALGGDPEGLPLLRPTRGAFAGEDQVAMATDVGPVNVFMGHLSHIRPPFSPSTAKALEEAARAVVAFQRHGAEIARRRDAIAGRVAKRFGRLASTIGRTDVVHVQTDADGVLERVETVTAIDVPDDRLKPTTVLLRMSDPRTVDKQSFDGYRIHARDAKRRLAILAAREPLDVYTVCPVAARDYAAMPREEAREKAADIRALIASGSGDEKTGPAFRDGKLDDTVRLGEGTTYRGITLLSRAVLPDAVLAALAGRPLCALVEDPRLDGLVIDTARCDSKGRLSVRATRPNPVPLRPILEAMEAK